MKFLSAILFIFLLTACSPKLYNTSLQLKEQGSYSKSNILNITATNGNDTIPLPENIEQAYKIALAEVTSDSCQINVLLKGNVKESYKSWWYLGILVLAPFWPAMPRATEMDIQLQATLVCNESIAQNIILLEEEHTRLFWYGPYRTFELQKRADLLHPKLIERLVQALSQNVQVDNTIRSDF